MSRAALIGGLLCLVIWIYLFLLHGRFWMTWRLGAAVPPVSDFEGLIAAVIPARNEAESIDKAVTSLLGQSCAKSLHIFVVDDQSTDGTAEMAREAAPRIGLSDSLTVIAGQALPPGWSGKLWAVHQGVECALELEPCYLLLTDADVQHAPQNVATMVAIAEREGYDLVSFMVKLHCASVGEKLLIPAFVFFFFMLYPPEWIRNPRRRNAGAAGGCMLIRPEALVRAGGIPAIRGAIIDDCALARAVKRSGGKVWLGLTPDTVSLRVYQAFGEIERMIARTAFNQLQHSGWLLLGSLLGLALTYVLPVALLFSGSRGLAAVGGVAYLLMVAAYVPMVRFYGLNLLWAITLPFSAVFYMAATMHSALKYWSGRGGEWKGRAQDVAQSR
jgi:hopene-associated glycosyltransferase HpnB